MATSRKQKPTKARTRKLTVKHKKQVIRTAKQIPSSFRLLGRAVRHVWHHKKLFGGILLLYGALYFILVRGLAGNFQLHETRQAIEDAVSGEGGQLATATTLFGVLIGGGSSTTSESGGVYQVVLFVIFSLAVIRALRQTFEDRGKATIKGSLYQGMYPLVPYVLVGLVILLQLVPALIGVTVFGIVTANGIAVNGIEQLLWLLVLVMSLGVSLYLLSASLFASYIVTLPNMTPLQALRSARKLVRFRRFLVLRKLLFLPLIILVIAALIFLPLVLYATVIAEPIFLFFVFMLMVVTHAYMYSLYRELL